MSEKRTPTIILTKKCLLESDGKKQPKICIKVELYPSWKFAEKWFPGSRDWYPKVPLKSIDRKEFWEKMYRVKVNNKWYGENVYSLFTEKQAAELLHV